MAQLPQIDSLRRPNAAASAASKPRRFPWLHLPLAIVVTLLVGYGLIIVYSAVRADGDYQYSRQLGGVAVGLVFMILVWRFDYRRLSDYTTLFLIINVVLIMSPHIPGLGTDAGMGARSWICRSSPASSPRSPSSSWMPRSWRATAATWTIRASM